MARRLTRVFILGSALAAIVLYWLGARKASLPPRARWGAHALLNTARKIRKFRELYPDIQLKVFYGRDFRSLVQKYGLSATPARSQPAGGSQDERQTS